MNDNASSGTGVLVGLLMMTVGAATLQNPDPITRLENSIATALLGVGFAKIVNS